MEKVKKDPKKTILLSLFPGLGFLYLENMKYFLMFFVVTFLPLLSISNMGSKMIFVSLFIYGLSIYYAYTLANETLTNPSKYKKDPYYVLCLSVLCDGMGQISLGQKKKGVIMLSFGMTSCLIAWVFLISRYGFLDLLLISKESPESYLYTIVNLMISWTIMCVPVKILSMIDAYYSTYHLYVAKK